MLNLKLVYGRTRTAIEGPLRTHWTVASRRGLGLVRSRRRSFSFEASRARRPVDGFGNLDVPSGNFHARLNVHTTERRFAYDSDQLWRLSGRPGVRRSLLDRFVAWIRPARRRGPRLRLRH